MPHITTYKADHEMVWDAVRQVDTIPTRNGSELMEIWVGKLVTIIQTGRGLLSCAYTTQLLHSTVEVCWNNNISYFIWIKLCAENLDK